MPAPSWEDLDDFLDEGDFAVSAVISLQAGGTIALSVIFDDPHAQRELGDSASRDEVMPTALCRMDLVASVRRGDTIAVTFPEGVQEFDILTAPQRDGTGMASLKLARQ